jgi:hypothetical protein
MDRQSDKKKPPVYSQRHGSRVDMGYVSHDEAKWGEFVYGSGLEDVKLYDYYDKDIFETVSFRTVRIMEELLADAISVGSIFLPGGYAPADFEIAFVNTSEPGCSPVGISFEAKPDIPWVNCSKSFHEINARDSALLSSFHVDDTIRWLANSMGSLFMVQEGVELR